MAGARTPQKLPRGRPSGSKALGYTQEQRGSAIQAGARAEVTPSPLTWALSTTSARIAARLLITAGLSGSLLAYPVFRPRGVGLLYKRALPPDVAHPLLVDPAGGYTPQNIWLAEDLPHAQIVEIDVPEVIEDKLRRLRRTANLSLPPNIEFVPADLSQMTLEQALSGRRPHVIEALGTYLPHADYVTVLRYLRDIIAPEGQGAVIANFVWQPGIRAMTRFRRLYQVQVGDLPGQVNSEDEARALFRQAGYEHIEIAYFPDLARELGYTEPANVELLAILRP